MQILGIVNVTRDSFSDGGRYLDPQRAIDHAVQLVNDGAAMIDVGAESTHPDAEDVPADEEIRRLSPIVKALIEQDIRVSVDAYKPTVLQAMVELGVDMINDVTGLRDPESVAVVRDSGCKLILMHSTATAARAERIDINPATILDRIVTYFERRIDGLDTAGIPRDRLILDPGMGFFLGRDPRVSLTVLREIPRLAELGLPLCISTSRKSFIGTYLGGCADPTPVDQRGPGTLATELYAAHAGAAYIRTHDVRALHDAWALWQGITTDRHPAD